MHTHQVEGSSRTPVSLCRKRGCYVLLAAASHLLLAPYLFGFVDCNGNLVDDLQEISTTSCGGTCTTGCLLDCNANCVLDECENIGFRVQFLDTCVNCTPGNQFCEGCGTGSTCACWTIDEDQHDPRIPVDGVIHCSEAIEDVQLFYHISGFGENSATKIPPGGSPVPALPVDQNGVYTVALPGDPGFSGGVSQNYFVKYKIGGVALRSQSVDLNFRTTSTGAPAGERPPVAWWYRWEWDDPDFIQDLINSGVITHLVLSGGNRIRWPECDLIGNPGDPPPTSYFRQTVDATIAMCHAADPPIQVIWARWLWKSNTWGSSPCLTCRDDDSGFCRRYTMDDISDSVIYSDAIKQILREADNGPRTGTREELPNAKIPGHTPDSGISCFS